MPPIHIVDNNFVLALLIDCDLNSIVQANINTNTMQWPLEARLPISAYNFMMISK